MWKRGMDMATTVERLAELDSCILADALDRLGLPGAVPGIRSVAGTPAVAAPVIAVRLVPDDGRKRIRHLGTAALESLEPGDAIVVANGGRMEAAAWGGLLARAATRQRAAGVIVDGAVRDIDEMEELGFSAFARGAVPISARGRWVEAGSDEPVELGSVRVETGDFVVADGTGVVLLPARRLQEILDTAEELAAREAEMAARLDAGEAPTTVLGRDYERAIDAHG